MNRTFGSWPGIQRQERDPGDDGKAKENQNLRGGVVQLPEAGREKIEPFFFGPFA